MKHIAAVLALVLATLLPGIAHATQPPTYQVKVNCHGVKVLVTNAPGTINIITYVGNVKAATNVDRNGNLVVVTPIAPHGRVYANLLLNGQRVAYQSVTCP